MPPRACSSPLVSCRRPSSHRFRTVVLRAVDFALSPFVLLISYRWLRDAARDVCAVSLPNAFLGGICSWFSFPYCRFGRFFRLRKSDFRPDLRLRQTGFVRTCVFGFLARLRNSDFRANSGLVQTQNQTYADTEPRLCRPESTSVFRQFLRGQLRRSTGGQLREAAVRTQMRRSTVRTPKWDPHQERPESVRITRITLSATIGETTTILIANFTGPST